MKRDRSIGFVGLSLLILVLGALPAWASESKDSPVGPESSSITDDKILLEAGRQIRRYAFYSIFDNVLLEARDGRVVVSGEVMHPWRSKDIERIVLRISGVRSVDNRLEVLPLSPFDDEIRYRVARAIYRDPALQRYGIQANPPIHVVVRNGNVTLTGVVHTLLEKAVAERAARFAATYFGLENKLVVETDTRRAAG